MDKVTGWVESFVMLFKHQLALTFSFSLSHEQMKIQKEEEKKKQAEDKKAADERQKKGGDTATNPVAQNESARVDQRGTFGEKKVGHVYRCKYEIERGYEIIRDERDPRNVKTLIQVY